MMAPYGITKRMIEAGLICPTWQIRLHPSGERAVFDLSVLKDVSEHPYRLQCEQAKYCRFVLEAVSKLPCVTVLFSTEVAGLNQTGDGVRVTAASPDGERTFAADYVIGADGARSAVRRTLGIEMSGDIYPETTMLATTTFPFHERLEGLSNVSYCWKPDGTFSLLRLPGVWRVSLYAREGQTVEQALEDEAQQDLLHDIVPDAGRIDVLETRPYRIHRRLAATYHKGRVFLAGDAAHLNSPSGGMGMNGGIHDAFNLCEKLIAVLQDGADESILDRYERQRRPIAEEEIIQQAHRNRTRMQERDPARRRAMLADLQRTVGDSAKLKAYLTKSSMIDGLRRAAATA
jgi:3-(3-hydroxy-phenyl)propionate hydroxylase